MLFPFRKKVFSPVSVTLLGCLVFGLNAGFSQGQSIQIDQPFVEIVPEPINIVELTVKADAETVADEEGKEEADEKESTLPPKLDKAIVDFTEKIGPARKEAAAKSLNEFIDEIAKSMKLDKSTVEALQKAVDPSVEASMKSWNEKAADVMRAKYTAPFGAGAKVNSVLVDNMVKSLEMAGDKPSVGLRNFLKVEGGDPRSTEPWKKTVANVLSEKQIQEMGLDEDAKRAKILKDFEAILDTRSEAQVRWFSREITAAHSDITSSVDLGEEREKKFDEAMKKAIDDATEQWKKAAVNNLLSITPAQQERMLEQGYVNGTLQEKDFPHRSKIWKSALDELLTEEERESWSSASNQRDLKAVRVGQMAMVSALDGMVALSSEQRKELEPLFTKVVKSSMLDEINRPDGGLSLHISSVISYAERIDQKKLSAVLTDWQEKMWKARVSTYRNRSKKPEVKTTPKLKDGELIPPRPPNEDREIINLAIAEQIYIRAERQRSLIYGRLATTIEDARRAGGLSDEQTRLLRIAAKGACEHELVRWTESCDSWIRRSVRNAEPDAIHARLNALGSASFGISPKAEETPLWSAAKKEILTEKQESAITKEVNARLAYRWETVAASCVHRLDCNARMTGEQAEKLEKMVADSMAKYAPDLDKTFGAWSRDSPWYLNSYYNLVGLNAVPEKDLKELLNEDQFKAWETSLQNQGGNYWSRVKESHTRRMKEEERERLKKEKAAKDAAKRKKD